MDQKNSVSDVNFARHIKIFTKVGFTSKLFCLYARVACLTLIMTAAIRVKLDVEKLLLR